jgi:hypothetical protein
MQHQSCIRHQIWSYDDIVLCALGTGGWAIYLLIEIFNLQTSLYQAITGPTCTNPKCRDKARTMKCSSRSTSIDKVAWRCTSCTTWKSIRFHTFLQFYNVSIAVLLTIILNWSIQTDPVSIAEMAEVSQPITISAIFQQLRYFDSNS